MGLRGKEMSSSSSRRATRRTGGSIDIAPGDLFVTTSWWTTWATRASVDPANIIYLVQEDERRFYPEGDDSIRCAEVLADPRLTCIVNSKPLFDYLFTVPDAHTARTVVVRPGVPGVPDSA